MAGEIIRGLTQLEQALDPDAMAKEAFKYFRDLTPRRTGNARRNTKLKGDEIHASYPYAGKLDEGSSSQAPDGMTKPTEKFIQEYIKKQIRT
jgi:hypothetical protein